MTNSISQSLRFGGQPSKTLTFDPYFRGSNDAPMFAANLVNGLVNVFNCFSAFSLCEFGIFSLKSRFADKLWKKFNFKLYWLEKVLCLECLRSNSPCAIVDVVIWIASYVRYTVTHFQTFIGNSSDVIGLLHTDYRCY